MPEGAPKQFATPEEEIAYLREQIAARERDLLSRTPEIDATDVETVARQELRTYGQFTPQSVLKPKFHLSEPDTQAATELVKNAADPIEELVALAFTKGIRNTLTVLEKTENAYLVDEVHRRLIEHIRAGAAVQDLQEGVPPWHIMHMTLYEITMPSLVAAGGREYQLTELVGMMEQLLTGLRTIGERQAGNHFVFEIAVADNSDDIVLYAAVPQEFTSLFEKQTLSLFPHAVLTEQVHDYNIFVDGGVTLGAELQLKKHPIYPLRTADAFASDPLAVILNAFSKIEREGGGAAIQFVVRHPRFQYRKQYEGIIKDVEKGMKPSEAIARSSTTGAIIAGMSDFFFTKKKAEETAPPDIDHTAIERFQHKLKTALVETNIRLLVSARDAHRAEQILDELTSTFNQFDVADSNQVVLKPVKGGKRLALQKAFSFRQLVPNSIVPLSLTELATLIHIPANGINSSPQFKQSHAQTAPAPTEMPTAGTLLGINKHRNVEKPIYVTELDRHRHFYIIGQTGTGKTSLMKNMIIQDIRNGDGVCMIDPHGTDIEDVLGAVPPEREQDIIYFDPSRLDRVLALNMLEYDPTKPEQKTFVVNEMLSIFNKLFDMKVAGGPMFEQYFRNATMLVMEDPASGSTLMDIGRVLADARFRRVKLEKATNPVVVQFWREIAGKAGGEASLENIVPYIVSKFDVFTANDYMRPIIGQQTSTLNFRRIMDERKILLVNLSKGRLGEINANLIGMIIVGKFLMAALSRVDDPTRSFPPFYLHMDEFQNVSTDSISAILSEARKYKLGLTIAHQFIAQLDPSIKDAVFGNVGSMAAFRVGPEDAQFLEQQFAPVFTASDLMNVPNYNAFMRVLANGTPTPPFSMATLPPERIDTERVTRLIQESALRHGRPRVEVEQEIADRYRKPEPPPPPPRPAMPAGMV